MDGVGHTYIEVNGTVFSYGRYAGTSSPHAHSGRLAPVGPGVLIKSTHQFAVDRMSKYPTQVYNFPEANAKDVYNYLNNLYNSGTPIQSTEGPGMVVGTYVLLFNDCTTVVMSGLRAGGVWMPAIVSPFQLNDYMNPNSHEQDIHFDLMP